MLFDEQSIHISRQVLTAMQNSRGYSPRSVLSLDQ